MTTPLLETRALSKDFAAGGLWGTRTRVIHNVDLSVAPGEIRGIVGESGSGKTTLARCSLRLLEPTSGATFFDGIDLSGLSREELRIKRREFQMVFQDPYGSLNPAMPVEESILEPLAIHRIGSCQERRNRVRELLQAVSLDESIAKKKPGELSGGQQQRVGIARSLALKPRLLLADEPVSALDVSVQAQILNLLSELKRRYALTIVLISHSLHVIHYLCTHVSVMYRGRIVEEAPCEQFFRNPRHPYSRVLIESMPAFHPAGIEARLGKEVMEMQPGDAPGCPFSTRCSSRRAECGETAPNLKEIGPGAKIACFLYP